MITPQMTRSHRLGGVSTRTSAERDSRTRAGSANGLKEGLGWASGAVLATVKDAPDHHPIRVDPVDGDKAVSPERDDPFALHRIDRSTGGRKRLQGFQPGPNYFVGSQSRRRRLPGQPVDLRQQVQIGLPAQDDPQ